MLKHLCFLSVSIPAQQISGETAGGASPDAVIAPGAIGRHRRFGHCSGADPRTTATIGSSGPIRRIAIIRTFPKSELLWAMNFVITR
jgi:hypothetical protein